MLFRSPRSHAIAPRILDRKAWLEPLLGEHLVTVRIFVREPDIVFVKGIFEASEGLGAVFAEPRVKGTERGSGRAGELVIAAPESRAAELFDTLRDLRAELNGALWEADPATSETITRDLAEPDLIL